jgi:hypothetical protein
LSLLNLNPARAVELRAASMRNGTTAKDALVLLATRKAAAESGEGRSNHALKDSSVGLGVEHGIRLVAVK